MFTKEGRLIQLSCLDDIALLLYMYFYFCNTSWFSPVVTLALIITDSSTTELDGYNPFKGRVLETSSYYPFGKPGAGAPLRGQDGKLNVTRRNIDFAHELDTSADVQRRRKAADEYLHELSE